MRIALGAVFVLSGALKLLSPEPASQMLTIFGIGHALLASVVSQRYVDKVVQA
jgi:uncharacterized membrane protein YphA (DoxX/SURF4 family)